MAGSRHDLQHERIAMSDPQGVAAEFAGRLHGLYGELVVAVLLYGSAARGEYRPGLSDLNVLVVLRRLELPELRLAAEAAREWVASGNPPPLMLSEEEWWTSADVFPLEYGDIRDAHVLLAGRDPFEDVHIRRANLRHQLEHELRSKKIQLREAYLVAGESGEALGEVLLRSLPTFLTLFRGLLRLHRVPVPRSAEDLVATVASEVGFRAAPVIDVVRAKREAAELAAPLDGPLAAGYLEAVERTVAWLDRHPAGEWTGDEV
jgi:hypothetical protein